MNLERIQKNNEIFLRLEANYQKLQEFKKLLDEIDADMTAMDKYYFGGPWSTDYEQSKDEQYAILSEDGIYNLYNDVAEARTEIIKKLVNSL